MTRPDTREKLIKAGLKTLHLRGFNGTAVQDITEAAGVPKGSFYNHFESKEALAIEAVQRFWENGVERRATLADASVEPVERLRQYFRTQAQAMAKDGYRRGCMIGNFSIEMPHQSPQTRQHLAALFAQWTAAFTACIDEARQAGRLRVPLPPAAVAAFILNAWEGALLRAKVEQNCHSFEHFESVVFGALFT